MPTLDSSETQFVDRVKLPLSYDASKMFEEFEAIKAQQFEYYKVIQLRAPAHMVDTSLPFPPPATDYADGSWTPWMDTPEMAQCAYLKSVIDFFKENTTVTLVRLLRLAPHSVVKEHTDPTLGLEIEKSVIRLTIPIYNQPGVEFFLNDSLVPMLPGECWYLRLTDPHRVLNNSDYERVNLTIDMIPNDWVLNLIGTAMDAN